MNIRPLLVLTAALILAGCGAQNAQAQNPQSTQAQAAQAPDAQGNAPAAAPGGRQRHSNPMMRALRNVDNVTDAQLQQIRTIQKNARAANKGVTDPATRKANQKQMRSQIEAVLTPEQAAQLRTNLRAEHRAAAGARTNGGGVPGAIPTPSGSN
jgi:Spy/CpxP family protein refolding chaperone